AEIFLASGDMANAEGWLTKTLHELDQGGHRARCVHPAAKLAELPLLKGGGERETHCSLASRIARTHCGQQRQSVLLQATQPLLQHCSIAGSAVLAAGCSWSRYSHCSPRSS